MQPVLGKMEFSNCSWKGGEGGERRREREKGQKKWCTIRLGQMVECEEMTENTAHLPFLFFYIIENTLKPSKAEQA